MHTPEIGPQEVDSSKQLSEREKERAALEALIDYAIQSAKETQFVGAGDAMEEARQFLSRSVLV
ncbi:hypothetical protein ACUXV3_01095 [Roseobacteraceae bacterium NS-SX3]